MIAEYPNLPLIEEKFKNIIAQEFARAAEAADAEIHKEGEPLKRKVSYFIPSFRAEVFMQTFPNTAGLFARPGSISGQAFSDYYITVICEERTGIYGVFQGDKPVYKVTDAPDVFFEDLKARQMATYGEAVERY